MHLLDDASSYFEVMFFVWYLALFSWKIYIIHRTMFNQSIIVFFNSNCIKEGGLVENGAKYKLLTKYATKSEIHRTDKRCNWWWFLWEFSQIVCKFKPFAVEFCLRSAQIWTDWKSWHTAKKSTNWKFCYKIIKFSAGALIPHFSAKFRCDCCKRCHIYWICHRHEWISSCGIGWIFWWFEPSEWAIRN